MMIRRSLIALGAAGLVALTATSPAHAADLGLRSVQASVQNMTGGTLTIALAEVLSGQWVSGEQPTLSEVLPVSGSMNAGVMTSDLAVGPSGMFGFSWFGSPITVAMTNPWSAAPAVHAVSNSTLLATVSQDSGSSTAQGQFTVSLNPSESSSRIALNKPLRGSMRLTVDNRTDTPLAITGLEESSILTWRGEAPSSGEQIKGIESWRFENSDGRGDAGVLMTLTGPAGARVVVASSMRADGSRSTDIIGTQGVDARVVHDPTSGWRVVIDHA